MRSFADLKLSEPILRAITELGFETPSPIQAETLPILLTEETDFLGLAATGTGKTAAFAIPLLERVDPKLPEVQALILCPTRELAIQVAGQITLIGKHKGVKALPIYGGAGYGDQIYGLKRGATIVVGTPGRVVDHMEKGTLSLDSLNTLVLDEADEMISMGFKDDLEAVLSKVPAGQARTWLFSATMSPGVRKVADDYLRDPRQVQINRTEMLPDTVEQIYYKVQEKDKPEILCKLIDAADDFYGIVFCQTKSLVIDLTRYLIERGYRTDCLHGDMDQQARERTMRAYREKKVTILIATDVACRGLDVKDVTHVVNYSLPRELDNYVHRIGRTGRIGKSGLALSLVTPSHRTLIGRIERVTKSRMKEGKIPSRRDIAVKMIAKSRASFEAQSAYARAIELMDDGWKASVEAMAKEEIVGRFLALLHPEVFDPAKATKAEPARPPLVTPLAAPVVSAPIAPAPVMITMESLPPVKVAHARLTSVKITPVKVTPVMTASIPWESSPRPSRPAHRPERKRFEGKKFGEKKHFVPKGTVRSARVNDGEKASRDFGGKPLKKWAKPGKGGAKPRFRAEF